MVVSGRSGVRHVNGMLGLLCMKHYPGLVDYAGKRELAYTFNHYTSGPDPEAGNKAVRVKRDFWVSVHCTTLLNTSHSLDFS
jgi:hypothetical protein